jgi:hypothetical protein
MAYLDGDVKQHGKNDCRDDDPGNRHGELIQREVFWMEKSRKGGEQDKNEDEKSDACECRE